MNNPFDYTPSELMLKEQQRLVEQIKSICSKDAVFAEEINRGKMFGILRVRKHTTPLPIGEGQGGGASIYAYSGQVCGKFDYPGFVPAIFDYLQPDGYFKQEEARIVGLNKEIDSLKTSESFAEVRQRVTDVKLQAEREITAYREEIKAKKAEAKDSISLSQFLNAELHRKKLYWRKRIAEAQDMVDKFESQIRELKFKRQQMSEKLQNWLFSQYNLTNYRGETIKLINIPSLGGACGGSSGLGDCCEPKLLNYAYTHGLEPVEIGMFWWGESPKGEVRHHLKWYPACQGKCRLILPWMGPPQAPPKGGMSNSFEVLYLDDDIIVIDKPSGLLSVPGKGNAPSVLSILNSQFSTILSVHRLDMDTSGVMVYARSKEAHKNLQRQFAEHTIVKHYHALLERPVQGEGRIELPLGPDYLDRPRQTVDYDHGKRAVTLWKSLGDNRVELTPLTGRTHQLRVHCAHRDGLDNPIKGDRLYASETVNSRLMLDAYSLEFTHPRRGKRMLFTSGSVLQ